MATAMSPDGWLRALKSEGIINVVQMRNWKTHNRDAATGKPFGPVHGLAIHHTAGTGSGMAQFCYNGTSALPGPLCHDFLAKDGMLYLVGNGRTNHAGTVADTAKQAILADTMPMKSTFSPDAAEPHDGNDFLYGIEIENKGDGKDPYPTRQYDVAVRWAAARCRYHGWSAGSIAGHKELTRRKIDPSFSMPQFRRDVAERLTHPASWTKGAVTPTPPTPAPVPAPVPATSGAPMDFTDLNKTTAKTIQPGTEYAVYFDSESADEPNDHGDGGKTFLMGARYTGTVAVWLDGATSVPSLSVKMRQELTDGTTSDQSSADIDGAAIDTVRAVSVTGSVPVDRKLTVVLKNVSAVPVTISRVQLRLLSQAL